MILTWGGFCGFHTAMAVITWPCMRVHAWNSYQLASRCSYWQQSFRKRSYFLFLFISCMCTNIIILVCFMSYVNLKKNAHWFTILECISQHMNLIRKQSQHNNGSIRLWQGATQHQLLPSKYWLQCKLIIIMIHVLVNNTIHTQLINSMLLFIDYCYIHATVHSPGSTVRVE